MPKYPIVCMALLMFLPTLLWSEAFNVGIYQPIITSTISKKDYILGTTVMMNELGKDSGIEIVMHYYDDPKKLGDDFNAKKLDYITADALSIVKYVPIANLGNGIMSYKASKSDSQTLVIVGSAEDKRPLNEQLHGVIASDGDACSELYIKTLLLEQSPNAKPDFLFTKSSQQSILKLFFGKADIALLDRATYNLAIELNPQIKARLSILKTIPLTIGPVAFMRQGGSKPLQEKVIALGKQMNVKPRGQQLLHLFRATTMDDSYTKDLDGIYALNTRYQNLLEGKKR